MDEARATHAMLAVRARRHKTLERDLLPPSEMRARCCFLAALLATVPALAQEPPAVPSGRDPLLGSHPADRELYEATRPPYQTFCAVCHGLSGRGDGPMAALLVPRPRDFTQGVFLLAATDNGVPSDDDLEALVQRGIPGTAMPSFAYLGARPRRMAVRSVRELALLARVRILREAAAAEGAESSEEEIRAAASEWLTPGTRVVVPSLAGHVFDAARGRELYRRACASCHGKDGAGAGTSEVHDAAGKVVPARDFTSGILKGGADIGDVFLRVRAGMPSSSMPCFGADYAADAEILDVVAVVRSLLPPDPSVPPGPDGARIPRWRGEWPPTRGQAARVGRIPTRADDAAWQQAPEVLLAVQPFDTRRLRQPDRVSLRALHDGTSIALRVSWADATEDRRDAVGDLVSIELSGRGVPAFFHATRLVGRLPRSGGPTWYTDGRRVASIVADFRPGHLDRVAAALGRPAAACPVAAQGIWREGRWSVLFRRELTPPAGTDELALTPGEEVALQVVVWDAPEQHGHELARCSHWCRIVLAR